MSTCANFTWSLGFNWIGRDAPGRYTLGEPAKPIVTGGPVKKCWDITSSQPPSTAFFHPPAFMNFLPLPTGSSHVAVVTKRWLMSKPARAFSSRRLYHVMPPAPPSSSASSIVFDHVQNEFSV